MLFDTVVWIAEGFLALFFLAAGLPKIVGRGIDRWVGFDQVPQGMRILIGACEIAAAIGLVVPLVADRGEWTTPLAGIGIAVISLMASGFHIRDREWLPALETFLWASLAGTIAVARWEKFSTGPAVSGHDVVVVLLAVLVPAIVINLVVLTRVTASPKPAKPASMSRLAQDRVG